MAYAVIKDKWYEATDPSIHFTVRENKESPRVSLAEIYKIEGDKTKTIDTACISSLSDEEKVDVIERLVIKHGFEALPEKPKCLELA